MLDATRSASGVTLAGCAATHQGTLVYDTLTGTFGDDVFAAGDGEAYSICKSADNEALLFGTDSVTMTAA